MPAASRPVALRTPVVRGGLARAREEREEAVREIQRHYSLLQLGQSAMNRQSDNRVQAEAAMNSLAPSLMTISPA